MAEDFGPRCSFCAKHHHAARKLLAALGAYICDECVGRCNEVMHEEYPGKWPWVRAATVPAPHLAAPGAGRASVSYVLRPRKAAPPVLDVETEVFRVVARQRGHALSGGNGREET